MKNQTEQWRVFIEENSHYMDEDERQFLGSYQSYQAAEVACREVVNRSLCELLKPGMTSEELFSLYAGFGEEPYIVGPAVGIPFSGWNYAREQCRSLCSTAVDDQNSKNSAPSHLLGGVSTPQSVEPSFSDSVSTVSPERIRVLRRTTRAFLHRHSLPSSTAPAPQKEFRDLGETEDKVFDKWMPEMAAKYGLISPGSSPRIVPIPGTAPMAPKFRAAYASLGESATIAASSPRAMGSKGTNVDKPQARSGQVIARSTNHGMKPSLLGALAAASFVLVFLGYMSLGIVTVTNAPPSAAVFLNHKDLAFASPPCVLNGNTDAEYLENLPQVKLSQAKPRLAPGVELVTMEMLRDLQDTLSNSDIRIRPDSRCLNAGGFAQSSSWLNAATGWTGSRWSETGEWLW